MQLLTLKSFSMGVEEQSGVQGGMVEVLTAMEFPYFWPCDKEKAAHNAVINRSSTLKGYFTHITVISNPS